MQHKEIVVLHNYFQTKNINPFSDTLEKPVKELMDLNMRTLQNFSYMTPTELLKMRRPEEMMEVFIENSHTAMSYMQHMFDIMEKHLLKNVDSSLKSARDVSHVVKSATPSSKVSTAKKSAKTTKSSTTKASGIKAASTKSATTKASGTKAASSKSKTSSLKKAAATTKTASPSKKKSVKHTSASARKPIMSSSSKSHSSSTVPHHSTTTTHAKPMMHDMDAHKKV